MPGFLPHDPPRQVFYQAWVDAKTSMPVALDDSTSLYELTFSPTPAAALVMPDRFKQTLAYYQRADAIARRL